ncbi:MAG: CvpA family protein [Verrucomicrobiota bacterium]|nr:CvpA family protein [Chthoniobacterales bacterium]MDQ3413923.1 CvpA family protein [Verrucomicrobiota bacterium]
MTAGSALWQTIFVSFALILIAFEIVRGWRLGLVRQLVRLLALAAAYGAGFFGGRLLLPLLRPFLRLPDFLISIAAGAILALIVYVAISTLGAILFKRTGEQSARVVRLVYGICGAVLGIFFGLFSVWLVVVAIRSTGAIASAEMRAPDPVEARSPGPPAARPRTLPNEPASMIQSLAKLKNSIELGPFGETVKAVDVVPAETYQILGKVGTLASNPRSAERFLSFPGARELTENPRIIALRDDPEIFELIQQQRYLELLQNPKLIEAMNDPALAAQVKRFEFQKALDYALGKR